MLIARPALRSSRSRTPHGITGVLSTGSAQCDNACGDSLDEVKVFGDFIVADPKICHGKLTFRGTRVFVADVLEQVADGIP